MFCVSSRRYCSASTGLEKKPVRDNNKRFSDGPIIFQNILAV